VGGGPKEEPSLLDFSLSTLTIIDYGVIVPVEAGALLHAAADLRATSTWRYS
jgi:hypothetical protein